MRVSDVRPELRRWKVESGKRQKKDAECARKAKKLVIEAPMRFEYRTDIPSARVSTIFWMVDIPESGAETAHAHPETSI